MFCIHEFNIDEHEVHQLIKSIIVSYAVSCLSNITLPECKK